MEDLKENMNAEQIQDLLKKKFRGVVKAVIPAQEITLYVAPRLAAENFLEFWENTERSYLVKVVSAKEVLEPEYQIELKTSKDTWYLRPLDESQTAQFRGSMRKAGFRF